MRRSYSLFLVQMSLVLSALSLLSFLMLSSSSTSATTTSATASVIVPSACTMSSTLNSSHTATIANGTSQSNIGKTTFNVVCNDGNGFAIYAVGYANDEYGNNKLLATIGGVLTPGSDIVTGTATSGATSNWAMKLTAVSGTYAPSILDNYDSSTYHTVPSTYTKVASYSSATDTSTGSSLEATYQAYIAPTAPAGSYNGTVRYTMVHPATELPNMPRACSSNKICYWPNANGEVADSMGDQSENYGYGNDASSIRPNMDVLLWASNYKRPGYGFAGWSDKFDWVLNENDANGNGIGKNSGYRIYGPNQIITTPSDMSNGISLYAVWVPNQGTLQNFTASQCIAMNIGEITALIDTRDNETYAVAKLADNKCWMIENLRLDYDATIGSANEAKSQGYGGVFSGLATPETANFTGANPVASNSLYKSDGSGDIMGQNGATLSDIGTANYPAYRMPRYRNDNTNSDSTINPNITTTNMTGADQNIYSYGNYYSWHAAIANTTAITSNNTSATTTSLCPSGWKLPQGGNKSKIVSTDDNDYWNLIVDGINGGTLPSNYESSSYPSYSSANHEGLNMSKKVRSYPNNFIYSGYASASSVIFRGVYGRYWSSTAFTSQYAYVFPLESNGAIYPGTNSDNFEYFGFSVRCMASS